MNCPSCGHENPDHAKFCLECAQPVSSGELRGDRDPRAYTPKHLADKILTSRSGLEGQHKAGHGAEPRPYVQ